jgi:hypothetical protein
MSDLTVFLKVVLGMLVVVGIPLLAAALLLRRVQSWFTLSSPWWMHLPAASVYGAAAAFAALVRAMGGPEEPIAYLNNVNQYPTFGHFLSFFGPIGVLAIAASVLLDELWTRQEVRKTYNWISLLDEVVIGLLLLAAYGKVHHFSFAGDTLRHTVTFNRALGVLVAVMLAAAVLLELLRRPAPRQQYAVSEDTSALEAELARRTESGERISYFEGQNPASVTLLVALICAASVFGAVLSWRASLPWVSLLLLVIAGVAILAYGGTRVTVTSTLLEVRLGTLGIRLLVLPTAEVKEVAVYPDGGAEGAGERELKTLALSGRRGVAVGTISGRRYLIGSDRPERLAVVLRAVTARV